MEKYDRPSLGRSISLIGDIELTTANCSEFHHPLTLPAQ